MDERVLAYVNGFRAAKGLEPLDELPPNLPGSPRSQCCPVAQAIRERVGTTGAISTPALFPDYVQDAIHEFDRHFHG